MGQKTKPAIENQLLAWGERLVQVALEQGVDDAEAFLQANKVERVAGTFQEDSLQSEGIDGGVTLRMGYQGKYVSFSTSSFNDPQVFQKIAGLIKDLSNGNVGQARQASSFASTPDFPEMPNQVDDSEPDKNKVDQLLADILPSFEHSQEFHLHKWEWTKRISFTGLIKSDGFQMIYPFSRYYFELLMENQHGFLHEGDYAVQAKDFPFAALNKRVNQLLSWPREQQSPTMSDGACEVRIPPFIASELARRIGVLFSGNRVKNYPKMRGWVGKRLSHKHVSLIDDPLMSGGWMTRPMDDEGIPSQKTTIIDRGVLKGFLHNKETAQIFDVSSTSNSVRDEYNSPSKVGTTNIHFAAGTTEHERWLGEVQHGFDIAHAIQPPSFTGKQGDIGFIVDGWLVENGVRTQRLSGVPVVINPFRFLRKISATGNDLVFSMLSRGAGSPSLYVKEGQILQGQVVI